jgi:urease accessory protein
MGWQGHLRIQYTAEPAAASDQAGMTHTKGHDRHHGPLRVLQRLYPEGPGICHHVLVHPPGGIVGGDELGVDLDLAAGTHALLTTPGATRYYRSAGELALQQVRAQVASGARLEWLPLETIAYNGCRASNHLRFELQPGAEMMGWDVLALGLPAAGQAWERGSYHQHLELPGVWQERAHLDAGDHLLLDSPVGWAGRRVLGTMWLAAGSALDRPRRETLLGAAHQAIEAHPLAAWSGVSATHAEAVVLRVLGERVEPVMNLLTQVRAVWRDLAWQLGPCPPRVWKT